MAGSAMRVAGGGGMYLYFYFYFSPCMASHVHISFIHIM
jgi:hypothetical protein